jgi:hypothetical protein
MNETPISIWKRPWRGPARALAWFGLLVAASFMIVCCFAFVTGAEPRDPGLIFYAVIISVALAGLAVGGFLFLRWLCCWRNLRRFLFVVACLITFVAVAYAEENWRGKYAWQRYRREWEARGEKFTIAALVPPPVPDEQNFALMPLLKPVLDYTQGPAGLVWHDTNGIARLEKISAQLQPKRDTNDHLVLGSPEKGTFADLTACAEFYGGNTNYPQAPAAAIPAEVVLVALGKFAPELKEFHEAAFTRPYSRFPIHYDSEPTWAILLPHLARVKSLATLTSVRATAELEAGRSADAFEDLKLGLRFSDSVRDEPILIDHLVRVAALGINLQTLKEGLLRHAWTEPQLGELESYLGSLDLLAEYELAMRGERACSTAGLDYVRRQGFRGNPMDYIGNGGVGSAPPFNLIPSGWFYQNMLTISRLFQDFYLPAVDARAHRVFPEVSENAGRTISELRRGPYTFFAEIFLPSLEKVAAKSARMQTYVDAARVASALERCRLADGRLPDNLDALTPRLLQRIPNDLIDGEPLRYRRTSEAGYLLYSIGWNRTDEGGEVAWIKQKKDTNVDVTQGDWVWQMTAREAAKP